MKNIFACEITKYSVTYRIKKESCKTDTNILSEISIKSEWPHFPGTITFYTSINIKLSCGHQSRLGRLGKIERHWRLTVRNRKLNSQSEKPQDGT